jgi:3-oxo-4,17-pregnadiene-20-carboxyl-CoA hydratase alpha subunit
VSDTATLDKAAFLEKLRAWIGVEPPKPRVGLDPVNEPMIRHWCEAVGDTNPVYLDPDFAARSVHGGIVAPPAMLGAWVMRPMVWPPRDPNDPRTAVMDLLDDAGFKGVVATNSEQEYVRYLRPGDRLTSVITIDDVSEEKQTALGPGHFFTTKVTYRDDEGNVVGIERFRMLKFKPNVPAVHPREAETEAPQRRPRPSISADTAFFWEGAKCGELWIQRCSSCGTLRHPPRPMCARCCSLEWDIVRSAGNGTLYSYTVHHYPPMPGFEMPYVVGLVELDDGVRMLANVIDVSPDALTIGMPLEVTFVAVDDELTLPMFRPAG